MGAAAVGEAAVAVAVEEVELFRLAKMPAKGEPKILMASLPQTSLQPPQPLLPYQSARRLLHSKTCHKSPPAIV